MINIPWATIMLQPYNEIALLQAWMSSSMKHMAACQLHSMPLFSAAAQRFVENRILLDILIFPVILFAFTINQSRGSATRESGAASEHLGGLAGQ